MFKPEKLLGGLLGASSRRGGANVLTGQLGMGVLGVAIAAAEHFMNKQSSPSSPQPGVHGYRVPPGTPGASAPPPPPGQGMAAPPPLPPEAGPAQNALPSAPPAGVNAGAPEQNEAVLLIRAMIAAANADGAIDQQERQRILQKFRDVDLSPEEHSFLVNELFSPASLDAIVSQVGSPELARQVYGVSLLAIELDTDAERFYLLELAQRLGLSPADRDSMHKALGIADL